MPLLILRSLNNDQEEAKWELEDKRVRVKTLFRQWPLPSEKKETALKAAYYFQPLLSSLQS